LPVASTTKKTIRPWKKSIVCSNGISSFQGLASSDFSARGFTGRQGYGFFIRPGKNHTDAFNIGMKSRHDSGVDLRKEGAL
jgi:hypothetical protein